MRAALGGWGITALPKGSTTAHELNWTEGVVYVLQTRFKTAQPHELKLSVADRARNERNGRGRSLARQDHITSVGTNLIHGEKCVISRDVSEIMPNFTENSRWEFQKFTENSRAPQTLFQGAMLMQTKKSVEQYIWNFWTTNIYYIHKY